MAGNQNLGQEKTREHEKLGTTDGCLLITGLLFIKKAGFAIEPGFLLFTFTFLRFLLFRFRKQHFA